MSFDSDFASTYNQIKLKALVSTSSIIDEKDRWVILVLGICHFIYN